MDQGDTEATATGAIFVCDGDTILLKTVVLPARSKNCMCSHPRIADATAEKIAVELS